MGWLRTLLLRHVGNRMDILRNERALESLGNTQRIASKTSAKHDIEILRLKDEVARLKLGIVALTRFLIENKSINKEELEKFGNLIDAEDGIVDGKLALDKIKVRLNLAPPTQ